MEQQRKEIAEHRSNSKKNKWERVRALSGILIAVVGLYATYTYNLKQSKLQELQAVVSFFPHLLSNDIRHQTVAAVSLNEMSNKELAARLILVAVPPENVTEVMASFGPLDVAGLFHEMKNSQEIRDSAELAYGLLSSSKANAPKQSIVSINEKTVEAVNIDMPTDLVKSGWAYLGAYSANLKVWNTQYFVFKDVRPEDLIEQELAVRQETGALNVRKGMPAEDGSFFPVIDVLKPGSVVSVKAVEQWYTTGYWWAKIDYQESKDENGRVSN